MNTANFFFVCFVVVYFFVFCFFFKKHVQTEDSCSALIVLSSVRM